MNNKVLINQLELAYSPICNFEFNTLMKEPIIQEILGFSSLYIIAQRPILSFENIFLVEEEEELNFEIHQKDNPNILKIRLPFFQENIAVDRENDILFDIGSHDVKYEPTDPPYRNIHGIKIYSGDKFLIWFSPEKFLQNYWKGEIKAKVDGELRLFTNYNVHYVGKATEQDIWKRLTGHSTLQEILSIEYPLNYGQLPTHEIVLLFYTFKDNIQLHSWDGDKNGIDDMVASLMGTNLPEQKTIFLDAEKALINAMQPKYNRTRFKSYPYSKDGLHKFNYNAFSYSFTDPITLKYGVNDIVGGIDFIGGDTIIIKENKIIKLLKHNNNNC